MCLCLTFAEVSDNFVCTAGDNAIMLVVIVVYQGFLVLISKPTFTKIQPQ